MNRYPFSSSMKRRRRSRKWVYFVLLLLIIFTVRHFTSSPNPVSVFGGADKVTPSIDGLGIENSVMLSTSELMPEPNLYEIPVSHSESNPKLTAIIGDVTAYIDAEPSRIIEARDTLNKTLSMPMSQEQVSLVKKRLSEFAEKWLFGRTVFPEDRLCSSYKVKPGDRLITLSKKFKVPYEILMQVNNISDPKTLRAGNTIKIINGPFHCRIYRSAFTMDLYLQDTYVRSFSVGLGKPGMETPTGRWIVKPAGKLISPTWADPTTGKIYEANDPDYPLGSRWIGLKGMDGAAQGRTGFAIHGTKNPEEIGRAASRGCIRLYNGDAILLYNLLTPGVSQVIVVD